MDEASAAKGIEFYQQVLDFDERPDLDRPNGVWDLGSAEAAELAKLAETTYRDVNIGLANQFALYASRAGIDIHRVIEASNSQPYSHIHRPGIAVGGHCIPIYPRLYLWKDPDATVVRAAREANAEMPERTVALLEPIVGPLTGQRVAVLGAAYRGGVKETAFSGVFAAVAALESRGATVLVHDPLYDDDELRRAGLPAVPPGRAGGCGRRPGRPRGVRAARARPTCPGLKAIVDGRRVTAQEGWAGATRVVLGEPLPDRPRLPRVTWPDERRRHLRPVPDLRGPRVSARGGPGGVCGQDRPACGGGGRAGRVPAGGVRRVAGGDFHAPHIPEEYGGVGADALATCIVIEEVARVCASSSLIPAVNKLGTMPLLLAASEEVKAKYLPPVASGEAMFSYGLSEREAGSDTASMRCRAVRPTARTGC